MLCSEMFVYALVLWGLMLACEFGRQRLPYGGQFHMSFLTYALALPLAMITFISPGSVGAALMVHVGVGVLKLWGG